MSPHACLSTPAAVFSPLLTEMGHEKRKGKEIVVHKQTRAEREAERAEMVAKAAEE